MATRLKEWEKPWVAWDGINISDNNVISIRLRDENNLILVNEDWEVYTDLQLEDWIQPTDDFPVGVTTGKILAEDWRPQNGIILNWKTTSWDYNRLIYATDWKLYLDPGTWFWNEIGGSGWSSVCNTKTFFISWASDLTTAQAILDWQRSWKNALIWYNNEIYLFEAYNTISITPAVWQSYNTTVRDWMSRGYSETVADIIKIHYDTSTGVVSSIAFDEAKVTNSSIDPTAIYNQPFMPSIGYQPASKAYVDQEIWSAIAWVYTYKGSVSTYGDLASITNPEVWDVYNVQDTGMNYAWDGTQWDALGSDLNNVRAFHINGDNSTTDTNTLTEAVKRYEEWKYPVIEYYDEYYWLNEASETWWDTNQWYLFFRCPTVWKNTYASWSRLFNEVLYVPFYTDTHESTWVVQFSISPITQLFLEENINYSSPYTPQYDGSPATKKYVDDSIPEAWYWLELVEESHFDTQGPCPQGFHVPTQIDANRLRLVVANMLGSDGDSISWLLKRPYAWNLNWMDGQIQSVGVLGDVWTSSAQSDTHAIVLGLQASGMSTNGGSPLCSGLPIRPFANEFVQPDSSWTTLYDGSGSWGTNAWVFWNQAEWLISIRLGDNFSNVYRITISDKNLWATTVWNSWDSITSSNSGNYYQWWNNYWFVGSQTPVTTQVDASGYGPGNYYSSSDFIADGSFFTWTSVQNDNLWWGDTDNRSVAKVYNNILPFEPENTGTTGQVLTKTATGYNWQNWCNLMSFWIATSSTTAGADLQWLYDWAYSGNYGVIVYEGRTFIVPPTNITTGTVESYPFVDTKFRTSPRGKISSYSMVFHVNVTDGTVTGCWQSDTGIESANAVIVDTVAPSNAQQWSLWYDTTNDALKTYDGTQWNTIGSGGWGGWTSYSAWDWISITNNTISNTMYPSNQSTGSVWNILAKTASGTAWLDAWTLTNVKAWNVTSATSSTLESIVTWVNAGATYSAILKLDAQPDVFVYGKSVTVGSTTTYYFPSVENSKNADTTTWPSTGYTTVYNAAYTITYDGSTYTWAYVPQWQALANVIEPTGVPYQWYFTPTADYHPATKKYVDDAISQAWWWNVSSSTINTIWTGTQTEYDAITTKSTTTLYFVIES